MESGRSIEKRKKRKINDMIIKKEIFKDKAIDNAQKKTNDPNRSIGRSRKSLNVIARERAEIKERERTAERKPAAELV